MATPKAVERPANDQMKANASHQSLLDSTIAAQPRIRDRTKSLDVSKGESIGAVTRSRSASVPVIFSKIEGLDAISTPQPSMQNPITRSFDAPRSENNAALFYLA